MCLDMIKSRVDAGDVTAGENANYLSDFPESSFWEALNNDEFKARLDEMFDLVNRCVQASNNEYLKALGVLPKPNRLPPALPVLQYGEEESPLKKHNSGQDFNSALVQQGFLVWLVIAMMLYGHSKYSWRGV